MDHEMSDRRISETLNSENSINSVHQETTENLHNSIDGVVPETVIVIRSDEEDPAGTNGENGNPNANVNELGSSKVLVDEQKIKDSKDEKHSCVIDVKCGGEELGENLDWERVCRICHLSSDQSSETTTTTNTTTMNIIQLGCGCKDELGIVHSHCAEAWFKIKGNR
uniref:RING-CH-type domain-containing protein n=1 Tax=Davidia involucrata TaxID=16924 RepID=A0A5B7A7J8_DAVIN